MLMAQTNIFSLLNFFSEPERAGFATIEVAIVVFILSFEHTEVYDVMGANYISALITPSFASGIQGWEPSGLVPSSATDMWNG